MGSSSCSLLTQSRTKRAQAAQELREREDVEKELSVVKVWIQESRELLLNPTQDIDALLHELEVSLSPGEFLRQGSTETSAGCFRSCTRRSSASVRAWRS